MLAVLLELNPQHLLQLLKEEKENGPADKTRTVVEVVVTACVATLLFIATVLA
jgi:hypothetical protein